MLISEAITTNVDMQLSISETYVLYDREASDDRRLDGTLKSHRLK